MESRELSAGLAGWLMGNLPGSYSWEVRGEDAVEEMVRPVSVVVAQQGEPLHRLLKRYPVVLRGEYLPAALDASGQLEQAGFPAGFTALCAVLEDPANFQSLRESLAVRGLLLRVLRRTGEDEFPHEETARRMEVSFVFTVQTGVPAGSAG